MVQSLALKDFRKHRHFTQIDPDPCKHSPKGLEELLDKVSRCKPRTDAIIVAGTQNVSAEDLAYCTKKANDAAKWPVFVAPSDPKQVTADLLDYIVQNLNTYLLVYHPVNAQNPEVMRKPHAEFEAMLLRRDTDVADFVVHLGYVVLTSNNAVGKVINPDLNEKRLVGYAVLAGREYPVVYAESSGDFPGEAILAQFRAALTKCHLRAHFVAGGGIVNRNLATLALKYADAIVVGNVLEEDFGAYKMTIVK